jgi:hypothetical protein
MVFNALDIAGIWVDLTGFGSTGAATFVFFGVLFNSEAPAFFASPAGAAFSFLGILYLLLPSSSVLHHTVSLRPLHEKKTPCVHRLRPAWHP